MEYQEIRNVGERGGWLTRKHAVGCVEGVGIGFK